MQEIYPRLWVGGDGDCFAGGDCFEGGAGFAGGAGWAVVHACRHPCYRWAAAEKGAKTAGAGGLSLDRDLYLDLLDGPAAGFDLAPFQAFLDFAEPRWQEGAQLLLHCNQGRSRAPSLALLFLAKRRGALPAASFAAARSGFARLLPSYAPGAGLGQFLAERWSEL